MRSEVGYMNRRAFLLAGGVAGAAGAAALLLPGAKSRVAALQRFDGAVDVRLKAAPAGIPILGSGKPDAKVWAYNGQVPGPEIRARQGDRLRVLLDNRLDEDTTIHWHGYRVPNAMDGVPNLTQAPVRPGGSFAYEFNLRDAGTYWFHPHVRSFEQVGRGLYAPLIVEEREPIRVDRDIAWVLDDWRIDSDGQIAGGFGSMNEAGMGGRIGNTITINGRPPEPLSARAGERIRLRLLNTANARIFSLSFAGHRPWIIAMDGQPVKPHEATGQILLAPGMRIDLILDMTGAPGSRAEVRDTFYEDLEYRLTDIVYAQERLREQPLDTSIELPPNPVPVPDIANAARHEIVFGGGMGGMMGGGKSASGMMSGGMMGGGEMSMMRWTVNGASPRIQPSDPIFTIPRGRSTVMRLRNETNWWHPIHLHGHSFRVVARNGKSTAHKELQDTVLIPPRETADIAFVADNPGDWMFHCHILEHMMAGMMATIRVS